VAINRKLLVGKAAAFAALGKRNQAPRLAIAQHGHRRHRAKPAFVREVLALIVRIRKHIGDMHDPSFEQRAPGDRFATGP
jgi:hypothetical protein